MNIHQELEDYLILVDVGARWITGEIKSEDKLLKISPDMVKLAMLTTKLGAKELHYLLEVKVINQSLKFAHSLRPLMSTKILFVEVGMHLSVTTLFSKCLPIGAKYTAHQGRVVGRDGELKIELNGERIKVGGQTKVWLKGEYDAKLF